MIKMVMAKGKAKLGTVTLGDKVKVVLEISKRDFFKNAKFFEGAPEEIDFVLGDMQMNIADYFDEEAEARQEDARRAAWLLGQPLRVATVDQSGVVQSLEQVGEGQNEMVVMQADEENASEDQEEDDEPVEDENEQEGSDLDTDTDDEDQWSDPSDDSDDTDQLESSDNAESEPDPEHTAVVEPTTEALEAYVLSQKPRFDDIPLFPDIWIEKKEKELSWSELAHEKNIPSNEIKKQYSSYRKKAKEHMKNNGAA
jgi:hypothetical protein